MLVVLILEPLIMLTKEKIKAASRTNSLSHSNAITDAAVVPGLCAMAQEANATDHCSKLEELEVSDHTVSQHQFPMRRHL